MVGGLVDEVVVVEVDSVVLAVAVVVVAVLEPSVEEDQGLEQAEVEH